MIKLHRIENKKLNYKAYLCVDSVKNGLAFGGCRFSPSVTAEEVAELAACMSLKLAPHGLLVGGAKGGFAVDPQNPLIFEILADFANQMKSVLLNTVVLGKDLGATDEMMDHLYHSIGSPQLTPVQKNAPKGKTPNKIREFDGYIKNMTGQGVAWSAEAYYGHQISKKRAVIQGAGAVGVGTAIRLIEMGAKIVAISDKITTVYCEAGLPAQFFIEMISGGLIQIEKLPPNYILMPSESLYSLEADIMILAAASHSVHVQHAKNFAVELVVEGSNFGLVEPAREILFKSNIVVIPDVIASSSSAAMVAHQMSTGNRTPESQLWHHIKVAIQSTARETLEIAKSEGIEPRAAFKEILAPALLEQHSGFKKSA